MYSFEEFYEEEDYFIFVLEYVPGCDLMTHFKNKTEFQTTQVIRIFHDILKGLAECHEVGVIHRDLKPQNIILSLG